MLHSEHGSIYRTILACFIVLAFCFALTWPQYAKYRDGKQLIKAVELGRALAFAEESYKQAQGTYTPQFDKLGLSLPCPLVTQVAKEIQLNCPHYTYQLKGDSLIKVLHKSLPVWVDIDIPAGTVLCQYTENDWAGKDLCARLQ